MKISLEDIRGGALLGTLRGLKRLYVQKFGAVPEELDILQMLGSSAFYWRYPLWMWRQVRRVARKVGVDTIYLEVPREVYEFLEPVSEGLDGFLMMTPVENPFCRCEREVSDLLTSPYAYLCLKRQGEMRRSRLFVLRALRSCSLPYCEMAAWVLGDMLSREDVPDVEKIFIALRLAGYDLTAADVLKYLNTSWAEARSYLRTLRKIATRLAGIIKESPNQEDFVGFLPVRVIGFAMFGVGLDREEYEAIKDRLSFFPLVDAVWSVMYPEDLTLGYVRQMDFASAFDNPYPFELSRFLWWLINGPAQEPLISAVASSMSPGQKAALALVMKVIGMETLARSVLADVQGKFAYWLDNVLVSLARRIVFGEGSDEVPGGLFELVLKIAFSPVSLGESDVRRSVLLPLVFALVEDKLAVDEVDEMRKRELLRDEHEFFVIRDYSEKVREIEKRLREITPDEPAKWMKLYHDVDDRVLAYQSMLDMFLSIDMSDLPKMVRSIAEEYYRFTLAEYLVFAVLSGENLAFYWHIAPPQVEDIHFKLDRYLTYPTGYHFVGDGDLLWVYKGHRLTIVVFAKGAGKGTKVPSNIASAIYASLPLLEALIEGSQYRLMSMRDHLTGLYSRWYLVERLEEEFERAQIAGSEFALLYIDVDNFKRVNDVYGHIEGDRVLAMLGNLLLSSLRDVDIASRYGGEEFVVLLPETSLAGACKVAQRLRLNVERKFKNLYGVTISVGVVHYPSLRVDSWEKLLMEADRLMYEAKSKGKNRVECYRPPEP